MISAWKCIALSALMFSLSACDLEDLERYRGSRPEPPRTECALSEPGEARAVQASFMPTRTQIEFHFGAVEGRDLELWSNQKLIWSSLHPEVANGWIDLHNGVLRYFPLEDAEDIHMRERADDGSVRQAPISFHLENGKLGLPDECGYSSPRATILKFSYLSPVESSLPPEEAE